VSNCTAQPSRGAGPIINPTPLELVAQKKHEQLHPSQAVLFTLTKSPGFTDHLHVFGEVQIPIAIANPTNPYMYMVEVVFRVNFCDYANPLVE